MLSSLFYAWTAGSNGSNPGRQPQARYYDELTDAFLHGHLYLAERVPPALLRLRNPYNPGVNGHLTASIRDLSLYHGHLYLSWGPTPVLTLYGPWKVLQLGRLHDPVAVALFSIVGLGFTLMLLRFLVGTYLRATPAWQVTLGAVALSCGNVVPFLLRRPAVYEVAVASGYCFAMAALYFFATGGLVGRFRPLRLAVGSACAGLAMGGRPDLAVVGLIGVVIAVATIRRDMVGSWSDRTRRSAVLVGPFVCLASLLLLYNLARFGSLLEFGQRYALAGADQSQVALVKLSNMGSGIRRYMFQPVRFTFAFPYAALTPAFPVPGAPAQPVVARLQAEIVGGLATTVPFVFVLMSAPWVLRQPGRRELQFVVTAVAATGLLILGALTMAAGITMRYEVDFLTLLLLASLLVWFLASRNDRGGRAVALGGAAALVYTSLLGVAISFTGYYDWLRTGDPRVYRALQDLSSPLPAVGTVLAGHADVVRIIVFSPYPDDLGNTGTQAPGKTSFLLLPPYDEVDVVCPSAGRYDLTMRVLSVRHQLFFEQLRLLVRAGSATTRLAIEPSQADVIPVHFGFGLNRVYLSVESDYPLISRARVLLSGITVNSHPAGAHRG